MNLFDRNRNELSKYSYDFSKATMISMIIIPFVQGNIQSVVLVAGLILSIRLLVLGMILKKGGAKMLKVYIVLGVIALAGIIAVLIYDHRKKQQKQT